MSPGLPWAPSPLLRQELLLQELLHLLSICLRLLWRPLLEAAARSDGQRLQRSFILLHLPGFSFFLMESSWHEGGKAEAA